MNTPEVYTGEKPSEKPIEAEIVMQISIARSKDKPPTFAYFVSKPNEATFMSKHFDKFSEVTQAIRKHIK